MKQIIGHQGEVRIIKIDELPKDMEATPVKKSSTGYIISHSESGHHHVLTGGDVMERTDSIPQGLQIFYAMLDDPESFEQNAPNSHEKFDLDPGIYEFRVSREYDPFAEQARRVAD